MTMAAYYLIFSVGTLNLSTGATGTIYATDRVGGYGTGASDTPASTQYLPVVDRAELPDFAVSLFGENRLGGAPSKGGASGKLRWIRNPSGRPDDEDLLGNVLSGLTIDGQPFVMSLVGTAPDGTTYTHASPLVLSTAVAKNSVLDENYLTFDVESATAWYDKPFPTEVYRGLGDGIRFDWASSQYGTSPFVRNTLPFTVGGFFMAATTTVLSNVDTVVSFSSDTITKSLMLDVVVRTADGIPVTEQFVLRVPDRYFGKIAFAAVSFRDNGSGYDIRLTVESSSETFTSTEYPKDSATTWSMAPSGYVPFTILGGVFFTNTWLSDDELETARKGRQDPSNPDLLVYWDGSNNDTGAGASIMYDIAEVNDPPLNATLVNSPSACGLLEGGEGLQGVVKPYVPGVRRNVKGVPVDPSRLVFQFANRINNFIPTSVGAVGGIYDGQAPYTIEAVYNHLLDFYNPANYPTGLGKATVCPNAGVAMLYDVSDLGSVTADISGDSQWGVSRACSPGASLVLFGVRTLQTSDFTIMNWFSVENAAGSLFQFYNVQSSGFNVILSWSVSGRGRILASISTSSGPISFFTGERTIGPNQSFHLAVTLSEAGGDVTMNLFLNGNLVGTGTEPSASLLTPTSDMSIAAQSGTASVITTSETKIFSSALTQDEIRKQMLVPGVDSNGDLTHADLEGYIGTNTSVYSSALWADSIDYGTSGIYIQVIGSGAWVAGGVSSSHRLEAVCELLLDECQLDYDTQLNLDDAFTNFLDYAIGYYLDTQKTIGQIIGDLIDGINGYCFEWRDGVVYLGQFPDPSTASPTWAIDESGIGQTIKPGAAILPASHWKMGWGLLTPSETILAIVSGERRALVSAESRWVNVYKSSNATLYPPGSIEKIQTLYDQPRGAWTEGGRQRGMRGVRRQLLTATVLDQWSTAYIPGTVGTITHRYPFIPSGGVQAVVLSYKSNDDQVTVELLT